MSTELDQELIDLSFESLSNEEYTALLDELYPLPDDILELDLDMITVPEAFPPGWKPYIPTQQEQ